MAERLNVLVIDDDDVDRLTVRRSLRRAGFDADVIEAATVAAGIQQLNGRAFDCIFLDYNLPDGTGLEILKRLQRAAYRAPVIILTGQGDEETAVELMKAGAADYIAKHAATPERLQTTVPAVMRIFRAEQGLRDAEEALRLAIESANIGTWDYNLLTNSLFWSDRAKQHFGLPVDVRVDYDLFLTLLHSDDRERVNEEVRSACDPSGNGELNTDYRVVWPDRSVHWVRASGKVFFQGENADRRPVRLLGTVQDVTEQREAQEALQYAVKMREDVLAIVSHDLRNPLNTLISSASLMTDIPLTPEQQQKQLEIIKRTGHQMNRLLQDLLDVSRIDAGRFNVEPAALEVKTVIDEVCGMFDQVARDKGLRLVCEISSDMPAVQGDRERLIQVFANLVTNATRFTPAGGEIRISATTEQNSIRFAVRDTGSGIPQEDLPFIFERFWQAHRARRMGAGLGLAIVKGIIEAHGGTISVSSEPGSGTTFQFTIPAVASAIAVS